ncbi:MAG: hypothetical protein Q3974_01425 [Rothia sp. (in: high G+C Gram-positive bacteria)]|nr:hypothetical protein [Rothia sp. (in: high G+C Gram-positive bacteria)]
MNCSHINRFTATPILAVLTITAFVGCGVNNNDNIAKNENNSATSSSVSSTPVSSASRNNNSASSSASSSESVSTSVTAHQAVVPAGYKTVTTKTNKVSFAVPEKWTPVNASDVTGSSKGQDIIAEMAQKTGMSEDALKKQMESLDLMVSSTEPDKTGFSDNVNVTAEPVAVESLPSKEVMQRMAESASGTAGKYSTVQTPLGKAAQMTYTLSASGMKVNGVFIVVPTGIDNDYSVITVSTGTPETANTYATNIEKSLSKVE